ncbi:hypothetical protein PMAYCL1PPCAC_00526, partial [Pristionchus mayeri]
NNGLTAPFMAELNEHIGTRMTYCNVCKVVTGTREEYYRHLLLTSHLANLEPDDMMLTFAVNVMKKDMVDGDDILPWTDGQNKAASGPVAVAAEKTQPQEGNAEEDDSGKEQQPRKEERILPPVVGALIKFFLRICEHFKEGTIPMQAYMGEFDQYGTLLKALKREDAQVLFDELVQVLDEHPLLSSAFCDRYMFTARQCFIHIGWEQHDTKIFEVSPFIYPLTNEMLLMMVEKSRIREICKQGTERVESLRKRWSSMSLDDPELRPTEQFIKRLGEKFSTT